MRGTIPNYCYRDSVEEYVQTLRGKLDDIHEKVRDYLKIKSNRVKVRYDERARDSLFEVGQTVWLFVCGYPQRRKGRVPKLQRNWEASYKVLKKLSDVVYCVRRSVRHKNKIVHADRLASFYERLNNDRPSAH